jgi:cytolysin-activating lysine-acyltransferase
MWKKKKAKVVASKAATEGISAEQEVFDRPKAITSNGEEKAAISASGSTSEAEIASAATAETGQRTASVRQVDLVLGQIVSMLMRSPQHKHYSLADLEWLVLPAVLSGQFRIVQAQGAPAPVGVALWANVSAETDQRLSDLSKPARLSPDEWRSGDISWLMELVCDARLQPAILTDLRDAIFKGNPLKMRVRGTDGRMQIATLMGAAEKGAAEPSSPG